MSQVDVFEVVGQTDDEESPGIIDSSSSSRSRISSSISRISNSSSSGGGGGGLASSYGRRGPKLSPKRCGQAWLRTVTALTSGRG